MYMVWRCAIPLVAGSLWARRVQAADGSVLDCWWVPPPPPAQRIRVGSPTCQHRYQIDKHPGLLYKFYPTYKMYRIELYLAELVIYESEQIETYLEFWTPVWTPIITSDGKITSWETCSVNGKQSVFPVSEERFADCF